MSRETEMLIALRDGYLDDEGELVEIKAGVTRIAPEILAARPQYGDFFERGHSAPGTNAVQARYRVTLPGSSTVHAF